MTHAVQLLLYRFCAGFHFTAPPVCVCVCVCVCFDGPSLFEIRRLDSVGVEQLDRGFRPLARTELPSSPGPTKKIPSEAFINGDYVELSVAVSASDRSTHKFIPLQDTTGSFSTTDIMTSTAQSLLLCALFLCGLEETVRAHHGYCAGNECFALFQDPKDYAGAQKSCKDSGGQLSSFSHEYFRKTIKSPVSGSFWLDGKADEYYQSCFSVSVTTEQDLSIEMKPCSNTLDGFVCQYTLKEPCGALQAGEGAQVRYSQPLDFDLDDSEMFPIGTIAVAEKLSGKYPDSKHVCFSSDWIPAPWNCEVLRGGCEQECTSTSPTTHTCTCPAGKTLHANKFTCTDGPYALNPCKDEGEKCEVSEGGFNCTCKDGFVREDGVCVNVTICLKCEHMKCDKVNGVYECGCRKWFRVSAHDPTKCEVIRTVREH